MSKEEKKEVLNDVLLKLHVVEDLLFLYDTEKPIMDGNEDIEELRYFMRNYRVCLEASLEAVAGVKELVEALYKEGATV